jgi:hypothetical protein
MHAGNEKAFGERPPAGEPRRGGTRTGAHPSSFRSHGTRLKVILWYRGCTAGSRAVSLRAADTLERHVGGGQRSGARPSAFHARRPLQRDRRPADGVLIGRTTALETPRDRARWAATTRPGAVASDGRDTRGRMLRAAPRSAESGSSRECDRVREAVRGRRLPGPGTAVWRSGRSFSGESNLPTGSAVAARSPVHDRSHTDEQVRPDGARAPPAPSGATSDTAPLCPQRGHRCRPLPPEAPGTAHAPRRREHGANSWAWSGWLRPRIAPATPHPGRPTRSSPATGAARSAAVCASPPPARPPARSRHACSRGLPGSCDGRILEVRRPQALVPRS